MQHIRKFAILRDILTPNLQNYTLFNLQYFVLMDRPEPMRHEGAQNATRGKNISADDMKYGGPDRN